MTTNKVTLSRYIEQTLLKPEATPSQIRDLCNDAKKYSFLGVCTNSVYVPLVKNLLQDSQVKVVTVVGFPLGAVNSQSKAFETDWAVKNGSHEIDMVLSVGHLKEKDYNFVLKDIKSVVSSAGKALVKVIIETALLTEEEKMKACQLSLEAGAHFVKTCTGFSGGKATVEDIKLMKSVVGSQMLIKASGGIKTSQDGYRLIEAGANRLGTSSGVQLVTETQVLGEY